MNKRKFLLASTLLVCFAVQYGVTLPAQAGLSFGGNGTNKGSVNVDGNTDVSGTMTNSDNGGYDIKDGGKLDVKEKGKVVNKSDGYIKNAQGGTVDNNGTIDNKYGGTVDNKGTLNNKTTLNNYGTLNNEGALESEGTLKNSGVFNSSGKFDNKGDFDNSLFFNNEGEMTNEKGSKATNGGLFTSNGNLDNKGTFLNENGLVTNNGNMTNEGTMGGGGWNNNGSFTNDNAFILGKDDRFNNNGTVVNDSLFSGGKVENDGTFTNNNFMLGSEIKNEGTFDNSGKILTDKKITNSEGSVLNNSGSILNGSSVPGFEQAAEIENNGLVDNTGSLNVKQNSSSTGTIVNQKQGTVKGEIAGGNLQNKGTIGDLKVGSKGTVENKGNINGTVTVEEGGTLHLGAGTTFSGSGKAEISGLLDATNGTFDDYTSGGNKLSFKNGAKVKTDISSATGQTDRFYKPNSTTVNPGKFFITDQQATVEDFNMIPDTLVSNGYISKEALERNLGFTIKEFGEAAKQDHKFLTPLRWLNARADERGIGFAPTGNTYKDFNPAVMAGAVAAQMGGYLTELDSFDEAFRNMDMYMLMTRKERTAMKLRNKYASIAGNYIFDPTGTTHDDNAAWFRPHATFESVRLKGGPRVSNVVYGTYFGAESEMYELKNGWDAMWGAYIGYNGSHQAYDGISIYQNGGNLGLVGMLYKGDFFTGLTINTGASAARANTIYGDDDFTLLMAGVASKTGYNWELADGKFIIQPNFMMSYSFVNTFDYTTSSGIKVNSDPLSAITFEPGLKFIGNLKNGWQPYMGVSVIWNAMDKTKFQASDATLPELSVKPFAKYGLGVRKTWGERLTGFFQAYFTSGGRNGVGFQAGVSYTFGKSGKPIAKTNHLKPALAKPEITMDNIKKTK